MTDRVRLGPGYDCKTQQAVQGTVTLGWRVRAILPGDEPNDPKGSAGSALASLSPGKSSAEAPIAQHLDSRIPEAAVACICRPQTLGGAVGRNRVSKNNAEIRKDRTMNAKLKLQTLNIDEVTDLELLRITGQGCEVCEYSWIKDKIVCWPCPVPR
jgi:hypothetical protein